MIAKPDKQRHEGAEKRVTWLAFAILLAFSVLVLRLWHLQIIDGNEYAKQAEENRLHPQRLKAPRGMIYGRDDTIVLADNRATCDLVLIPAECPEARREEVCRRLERLLDVNGQEILKEIAALKRTPYKQVMVKRDASKTELARVGEYTYLLPGVMEVVRPQRRYNYGKVAGQLLGYIGEAFTRGMSEEEKQALYEQGYRLGDYIGKAGLESLHEETLRGEDGGMVVVVYRTDRRPELRTNEYGKPIIAMDSYGRKLDVEQRRDPEPGTPIYLTIDVELQAFCENLLEGEIGAIAVIEAKTGEVLALASSPGYDPNIFVAPSHSRTDVLTSRLAPLSNRSYQAKYAPGSVFKVMLAAAALEEGKISEKTSFTCHGSYTLGSRRWGCWKKGGHGATNVVDALAYSCDVFFYNVGLLLGVDTIKEWADRMGLGVPTGIDLPGEEAGLVPSREWKKEQMKERYPDNPWEWQWYDGNTLNLSIGQGETGTTPLQNAVMMATVINGGYRVLPYVDQARRGRHKPKRVLSDRTLEILQKGMRKCVEKEDYPSGTGRYAKIEGMVVMGKTGTAQVVPRSKYEHYENEEDIPYLYRDNALFIAGVPGEEPPIAISIIIEHGLHGSTAAAPRAKQIIEFFYRQRADHVQVAKREESS